MSREVADVWSVDSVRLQVGEPLAAATGVAGKGWAAKGVSSSAWWRLSVIASWRVRPGLDLIRAARHTWPAPGRFINRRI